MQKSKSLRYVLFGVIFACALAGILIHSYIMLAILMVAGILVGIVGEVIENRPTKPYEEYNRMHDRHGHHDAQS